jgi:hypothetical protein
MQKMNTINPRNASEALRYARTAERAQNILKEGYTFHRDPNSDVVAVCKPGRLAASYWLNMLEPGCDCPDFRKHKDYCKHTLASEMLEAREDEEAGLEAQCAEYDLRAENEW